MKPRKLSWEYFNCKQCGKCCVGIGFPWPGSHLYEIAKFLKISPDEFIIKYMGKIIEKSGKKFIEPYEVDKNTSCPFLSPNNLCLIYDVRPNGCRSYPVDTDFGMADIDCHGFD